LHRLASLFPALLAILFVGPPFVGSPFGSYLPRKAGDVFDLLTPLIFIPRFWLLLKLHPETAPSRGENPGCLVLAALWVMGKAMHLVVNSIEPLLLLFTMACFVAALLFAGWGMHWGGWQSSAR
jgi:hypothetical protein